MPINENVHLSIAEIRVTSDDYFMYYPEMEKKLTHEQVTHEIVTSEILHQVFNDFINNPVLETKVKGDANFVLQSYTNFLHTIVCKKYLGISVRNGRNISFL